MASSRGSCFAGFVPVGLPTMYHQVLHEKMVILLNLEEAIDWYCKAHKLNAEEPGFVPPPVKDAY